MNVEVLENNQQYNVFLTMILFEELIFFSQNIQICEVLSQIYEDLMMLISNANGHFLFHF